MNPQPSKRFRWVGQPSEEELLGIPVSTKHHHRAVVRAVPAPPTRPVVVAPSPGRRVRGRDFFTVLGTALIIWLVLGGAGAGFHSSGATPVAPKATDPAPDLVHLDRGELGRLPRSIPSPENPQSRSRPAVQSGGRGSNPGRQDDFIPSLGSGSSSADDSAERPLVEATLPVVGSVTVEEPELLLPEAPELPPVPELTLP